MRGDKPPRSRQGDSAESGLEPRLRRGSASGRAKVSCIDHRRCIHKGTSGHRSRAKLEGRRCSACTKPNPCAACPPENAFFRDNGSEFTTQAMALWAYHAGVQIDFSRPGTPTDNAYVESFNGTLRSERLDAHWFATPPEAKQVIETWRREYNEGRPHWALGERTPNELAKEFAASRELFGQQTAEDSLSG
jgi:hypothetical protein